MATLYVASIETFVGKSALCIGLLERARRDGFTTGYMKPISVSVHQDEEPALDEDATFIRTHFQLTEGLERLTPVRVTSGVLDKVLREQSHESTKRFREAYLAVSRGKDLVILEGANNWAEGSLIDLSVDQISEMLQSPVLLICRYAGLPTIDQLLAVQRYLGERLVGVLLNHVDETHTEYVRSRVVPFLEKRGIAVYGTLPHDRQLAGITVGDLHEHLGGQVIGASAWLTQSVESLLIGAMGVEAAQLHFRRHANKAVFTGGDRTDLQLAALETSTSALVLTGNVRPSAGVIDRAEECHVPIILLADDTLSAIERADSIFGHTRFKHEAKVARFIELLDQHFDFTRLYEAIGLVIG